MNNNRIAFRMSLTLLVLVLAPNLANCQDRFNIPRTNSPSSVDRSEGLPEDMSPIRLYVQETRTGSTVANQVDQQVQPRQLAESDLIDMLARETKSLTSREGTGSSVKLVLLLGALSLAPAILLMTTCYIRIIVVLTLLRQAFGGQQLPPNQVLTALSLFMTLLVMAPVWKEVKTEAIDPYSSMEEVSWEDAWQRGIVPVKEFMARQIEVSGNTESVAVFYKYSEQMQQSYVPERIQDVPINVLLPAFVISELKVAFLLGFQIFLPFLVLDFVVSTVTVSMGMLMLPPTMVSFPLKLILFVMVDGWSLVIGMLLQSFGPLV